MTPSVPQKAHMLQLPSRMARIHTVVASGADTVISVDYGVEESVSIDALDSSAITKKLEELVLKGETMPK